MHQKNQSSFKSQLRQGVDPTKLFFLRFFFFGTLSIDQNFDQHVFNGSSVIFKFIPRSSELILIG